MLPGIHRPNRPCLCWKIECCKATWRNWRERGACTHCSQLKEYPRLPTPPLPTPLSPIISFHISSWYQFCFCLFYFWKFILHIFLIIIIVIRCSGMFQNVPCSWFYRRPLLYRSEASQSLRFDIREFKKTTTATATATRPSLNKRFNELNNSCARAFQFLVHFFAVLWKQQHEMTQFCVVWRTWTTTANFSYFYLGLNTFVAYSVGASFNTDRHTG